MLNWQNETKLKAEPRIDGKTLAEKFAALLHAELQAEPFKLVKQHETQAKNTLDEALKKAAESSGSFFIDPTLVQKYYFESLDNLSSINTAWKLTGFNSAQRPPHHVAIEVANKAKEIFKSCVKIMLEPQKQTLLLFDQTFKKGSKNCSQIVNETREVCNKGQYTLPNGEVIHLDPKLIQDMQTNTHVIIDPPELSSETKRYQETLVEVIMGDTLDVAQFLLSKGLNPVALNMAHPRKPGGEWQGEGGAQEEHIFRRMNYFQSLEMNLNKSLALQMQQISIAAGNKKPLKYKVPYIGGIYSPNVYVIRKSSSLGNEFVPPFNICMLAAIAHNPSERIGKLKTTAAAYREGTENKIRAIMRIAAMKGHDSLVLGALGCGAFRMDAIIKASTPQIVAECFAKVIKEKEFEGVFKNITFAILDKPDSDIMQAFKRELNFVLGKNQAKNKT